MLEPYAGKLACPVLREEGSREAPDLPGAVKTKESEVMDRNIIIVNVLIHGFAAAHAATAAALAQTMAADDVALASLTVAMIIGISRVYGRPFGVGEALAVLGLFAGFYLGTRKKIRDRHLILEIFIVS